MEFAFLKNNLVRNLSFVPVIVFLLFIETGLITDCCASATLGNQTGNNCEKIFVHLNKSVYVAGENLFYKVYLMNGENPANDPESKVLYFSMSGPALEKPILWRINIQSNSVQGIYKMPENLKGGTYELKVYTNRIKNNSPEYVYSKNILILSLSEQVPDTLLVPVTDDISHEMQRTKPQAVSDSLLQIRSLKPEYSINEKVTLEISLHNLKVNDFANLSLSVSDDIYFASLLNNADICEQFNRYNKGEKINCSNGLENFGFILKGKVKSKLDRLPVINGKIILGVVDSISPLLLYTETDSSGCFMVYLKSAYDNRELILQLLENHDKSGLIWEIEDKSISCGSTFQSHIITDDELKYLNSTKDIRLIEAIYTPKNDVSPIAEHTSVSNYFKNPDILIYPADYTDLINFKEITDNILPTVRFVNRDKDYSVRIFEPLSREWLENSMVLLNGIPFTDLDYIASLGSRAIKRIEVIQSGFLAGDLTFNGVLSIYTYDNKIPAGYLKNNTYVVQNPVNLTNGQIVADRVYNTGIPGSHHPDFRNNLIWKPNIIMKGDGKVTIEFPASQLSGKYGINIQGITSSGIPLSLEAFFDVK
jgi:hypothetical protein